MTGQDMSNTPIAIDDIRLLVDRATTGDEQAMLQIVDRYRQRVFGLCYRMLGQREDAEDACQEAFLRVLNNLRRWDPTRAFEPWLMTIAANRCRTHLSKRKKREPVQTLPFAPADDRWQRQSAADQLLEEVQLVLCELPDRHAQAFSLFHEKQLSYAEIAGKMEVPEGTVKTWVHRARHELIRRLAARKTVEPPRKGESRHAM